MVKVGAALCTMKRPALLAQCLRSIGAQAEAGHLDVTVIVVDNDAGGSARQTVADFANASPFPVVYVVEPIRGIASARNRALEELVKADVEWFAFADDDQVLHPLWLSSHYDVAVTEGADMVQSRLVRVVPDPAPFWCFETNEEWKEVGRDEDTIVPVPSVATGGSFYSGRLIKPGGLNLRFETELNLAGGEDVSFAKNAVRLGAKAVRSERPTAFEQVHPSRLSFSRYTIKGLALGGRAVAEVKRKQGSAKALRKFGAQSVVRVARGVGQIAVAPFIAAVDVNKSKFTALEGGRNIMVAAGYVSGFFNYQYNYYSKIDGN